MSERPQESDKPERPIKFTINAGDHEEFYHDES